VIHRLHQEDGCQVLGILPTAKYQRLVGGAPSLRLLADALARWGIDPVLDQRALLQMVTMTTICGNADLHAKNVSFLHDDGFRLAPVYDVVSTSVYPDVDLELGLFIGSETFLDDVHGADLIDEAAGWGLGRKAAISAVRVSAEAAAELAPAVLERCRSTAPIDEHVEMAARHVISRSQTLLAELSSL
jgi:serine/threonine-protein kinase HipA